VSAEETVLHAALEAAQRRLLDGAVRETTALRAERDAAVRDAARARTQLDAVRRRRVVRLADAAGRLIRRIPRTASAPAIDPASPIAAPVATTNAGAPSSPLLRPWSQRAWSDNVLRSVGEARAQRSAVVLRAKDRSNRLLRVAAIVTDETALELSPECELRAVRSTHMHDDLWGFEPDILLVEPRWHEPGEPPGTPAWPVVQDLSLLLEKCAERGVATVFWHTADPDRYDDYLELAAHFDLVCTPDSDAIAQLRRDLGHTRIHLLPFAGQPRLHSPVGDERRREVAVFAGGYYHRSEHRARTSAQLLRAVAEIVPLEISDRNAGGILPHHRLPDDLSGYAQGWCRPEDLAARYRGAAIGLNVGTVTASASLFPRRVAAMALTGTPVLSAAARSIRLLFGELVTVADGGATLTAAVRQLLTDHERRERLTTIALRKTLREHTWTTRLRGLVAALEGRPSEEHRPSVAVLGRCPDAASARAFVTVVAAQRGVDTHAVIATADPDAAEIGAQHGMPVTEPWSPAPLDELTGGRPAAVFDPGDWYGPDYLIGLAQAPAYTDASWITKAEHIAVGAAGLVRQRRGEAHRQLGDQSVAPARSLATAATAARLSVAEFLADAVPVAADGQVVSIDPFDYCAGGAHHDQAESASSALPVYEGMPLAELETLLPHGPLTADERADHLLVDPDRWPAAAPAASRLDIVPTGGGTITLDREDGAPATTVWAEGREPAPDAARLRLDAEGTLAIKVLLRWIDDGGRTLRTDSGPAGLDLHFDRPDRAVAYDLGLRVEGAGTLRIRALRVDAPHEAEADAVAGPAVLVVTDAYPAHDNLYRYGFVHARVRAYRRGGIPVGVFTIDASAGSARYEFEGVEVETGGAAALRRALRRPGLTHVFVHFLSAPIWRVLEEEAARLQITVWVHGSEVQGWQHRPYADAAALAQAQRATAARATFWRHVLATAPESVRFAFVSKQFLIQTLADLGVDLPESRRAVIPNPIDTMMFTYAPKHPAQRLRILSIRPHVGPIYANDLAVAAVRDLADEPWFGELEFRFIGDGPEFEKNTAPLAAFANVTVERRFATQHEIAALHKEYGVLLIPTRADTHGVSRDEAMSSGLVPVTTCIAAVPEFVSEAEGYLAPPDDAIGLADAIRDLYAHPEVFQRKSAAAAARIRRTTDAEVIIPAELSFAGVEHDGPRP